MWELRWVLLGLGVLLFVGVYFWSRGAFKRRAMPDALHVRAEPTIGPPAEPALDAGTVELSPRKHVRQTPERIVALRLIPRAGDELGSERTVGALTAAGLEHGRYGIFHLVDQQRSGETVFSVASLTEPGTFDLQHLDGTIAGLSFFLVLPGAGDPVTSFDKMIETARRLTVELEAELRDESGSSWSVQRERYVREELIEYRDLLERH